MMSLESVILTKLHNALGKEACLSVENVSSQHHGHTHAGNESHFLIRISKDTLPNLNPLKRHRMIYKILQDEFQKTHSIEVNFE
ncbi:MAG: bolA-like family protein [Candidatus Xenolissoclinum pacificiensis L6]|uniref:BolA-like family protein n=1 Tax=Candidatus Xenolissoclinum pacificiensis L6 TaxID=1401685 RepID=W2UZL4_9RICK|nr:MAG: bolA-like family protein [Candidatus Xenolissoclinum pacificiensis L6]